MILLYRQISKAFRKALGKQGEHVPRLWTHWKGWISLKLNMGIWRYPYPVQCQPPKKVWFQTNLSWVVLDSGDPTNHEKLVMFWQGIPCLDRESCGAPKSWKMSTATNGPFYLSKTGCCIRGTPKAPLSERRFSPGEAAGQPKCVC